MSQKVEQTEIKSEDSKSEKKHKKKKSKEVEGEVKSKKPKKSSSSEGEHKTRRKKHKEDERGENRHSVESTESERSDDTTTPPPRKKKSKSASTESVNIKGSESSEVSERKTKKSLRKSASTDLRTSKDSLEEDSGVKTKKSHSKSASTDSRNSIEEVEVKTKKKKKKKVKEEDGASDDTQEQPNTEEEEEYSINKILDKRQEEEIERMQEDIYWTEYDGYKVELEEGSEDEEGSEYEEEWSSGDEDVDDEDYWNEDDDVELPDVVNEEEEETSDDDDPLKTEEKILEAELREIDEQILLELEVQQVEDEERVKQLREELNEDISSDEYDEEFDDEEDEVEEEKDPELLLYEEEEELLKEEEELIDAEAEEERRILEEQKNEEERRRLLEEEAKQFEQTVLSSLTRIPIEDIFKMPELSAKEEAMGVKTKQKLKGLNVIVKRYPKDSFHFFKREIEALRKLGFSDKVSQLYGYSNTESHYFIISEGTGTTLADYILNPNVEFDMRSVLRYALNICRAVSFLHSKRLIHRDLTVESHKEGRIKLSDFGSTVMALSTRGEEPRHPAFAAPEVIEDNHTKKVDVYSFGKLLWSMLTRSQPPNIGKDILPLPPVCGFCAFGKKHLCRLKNLMMSCWNLNPEYRPEFNELYDQIILLRQTIDWVSGYGAK